MKKLITITAFYCCLLLPKAKATIIYKNIKDTTITTTGVKSSWVPVDFNSDGTAEYNFRWDVYSSTDYYIHTTYSTGNKLAVFGAANPFGTPYLHVIDAGVLVNKPLTYLTSVPEPLISDNNKDNFKGKGDKYIGTYFTVAGKKYYGWILINYSTTSALTLKSYAYENIADSGIVAGDTGTATPAGPKADFSVSATTGTTATVFTFTDKSTGTPTAYKWTFTPTTVAYQGTSTATSASPSVKFTAAGTYSVKLFTSNATGKDSLTKTNLITITPTSIKDVNGNVVDFNVYPNPAQDFFMVDKAFIGSDLQIIDAQGKLVQAGKLINSKIDITNLASGLYFVKVINGEDVYTQTISVSK